MSAPYDPVPDAIEFLSRATSEERHAIARLLEVDRNGLKVLRWIVTRSDCDLATAAMTFWRVQSLSNFRPDLAARREVAEEVVNRVSSGSYATDIAWDGREAWDRTLLIGAQPIAGLSPPSASVMGPLSGPFGTKAAGSAQAVFLDAQIGDIDFFDAHFWRHNPSDVAIADWLQDKPPETWMAVIEDSSGHHLEHLLNWMIQQPECATSVAGLVFWRSEPSNTVEHPRNELTDLDANTIPRILNRWRNGEFVSCDLDFSRFADGVGYRETLQRLGLSADPWNVPADLLDPESGRASPHVSPREDFDYWRWIVNEGSGVPRPREAAIARWKASHTRDKQRTPLVNPDPGMRWFGLSLIMFSASALYFFLSR